MKNDAEDLEDKQELFAQDREDDENKLHHNDTRVCGRRVDWCLVQKFFIGCGVLSLIVFVMIIAILSLFRIQT